MSLCADCGFDGCSFLCQQRQATALRERVATLEKENAGLRGLADLLPRATGLTTDAITKWQAEKQRVAQLEVDLADCVKEKRLITVRMLAEKQRATLASPKLLDAALAYGRAQAEYIKQWSDFKENPPVFYGSEAPTLRASSVAASVALTALANVAAELYAASNEQAPDSAERG